tara:strand:+ start:596 stop:1054 length:459 start_codon:yes stop_codon:yes gene_type:complete
MSKFKVGDKIIRAKNGQSWAPIGFKCVVVEGGIGSNHYVNVAGCKLLLVEDYWKLARSTPKWTIYNNTLPWSELSDKQKGKMLLAQNNKLKFESFTSSGPSMPFSKGWVYVVEKPEPVKPEPTMSQLFTYDINGCTWNDLSSVMIAKGWVKK